MSRIHRKVISDMLGRFFLSTSLSTCLYVYLMWFIHEFLTLVHKFLKMYDHIKNISQWNVLAMECWWIFQVSINSLFWYNFLLPPWYVKVLTNLFFRFVAWCNASYAINTIEYAGIPQGPFVRYEIAFGESVIWLCANWKWITNKTKYIWNE